MCDGSFEEEARLSQAVRLRERNAMDAYRKDMQGRIYRALVEFRLWCLCKNTNPYGNVYALLKDYIAENDETYKGESVRLFRVNAENSEETVVRNKKLLLELLEAGK